MDDGNARQRQDGTATARGAAVFGFLRYVLHRFAGDQCPQRAAALTYTTLLALVPLLAISFALFSAFEAFGEVQKQVQDFIFENFVPQVGSVVQEHLQEFAGKTRGLTLVGSAFLAVTSVMLLSAIGSAFNDIWRVRQARSLLARLPIYWMILTLAPLLLGVSMALSTYLFALARESGVEAYTGPLTRLAVIVPIVVQIAALFVLYRFAANYPVRWRDALVGAVTAGLVLEILKKGFGYYVSSFPTYQTIYGALATVPIFLIWMYVLWNVVLGGAEIAAALPEWRNGVRQRGTERRGPAALLTAAAAVLSLLLAAHRVGGGLRRRHLLSRAAQPAELLEAAVQALRAGRYIQRSDNDVWFLARDLDGVTLADFHRDLGLSPAAAADQLAQTEWATKLAATLRRAETADRDAMADSLESLLVREDGGIERLVVDPDADEDEADDDPDAPPRDYKTRLLALLGLAWLTGR